MCTKVLELPQFCAAALGLKQCVSSLIDHTPFFAFVLSFPQRIRYFILTSSRTLQELSTHVHVRYQPILLETTVHKWISCERDSPIPRLPITPEQPMRRHAYRIAHSYFVILFRCNSHSPPQKKKEPTQPTPHVYAPRCLHRCNSKRACRPPHGPAPVHWTFGNQRDRCCKRGHCPAGQPPTPNRHQSTQSLS